MSSPGPKIAVIGGGIAGTLCSLVLKNRGLQPTIIDAGTQVGGRLRRTGAQFLRTADPRLATVIGFLEREGLLQEWKAKFGMLGSLKGGFLPAEIVALNANPPSSTTNNPNEGDQASPTPTHQNPATDGGDFCKFVEASTYPTFVGMPSMADLCTGICARAGIETWNQSTLTLATPLRQGGWALDIIQKDNNSIINTSESPFEALVIATHDPSIAANAIQSIVKAEQAAASNTTNDDDNPQDATNKDDNALVVGRLSEIANSLQMVRDQHKQPVYTVSLTFPEGFDDQIPFDAVSIPGSQLVQFLAKESSKPSHQKRVSNTCTWTAVTTTRMANVILSNNSLTDEEKHKEVEIQVAEEVSQLLSRYASPNEETSVQVHPMESKSYRWGAAFTSPRLQLKEDSIVLSPWRLSICGDYIREGSAYSNPLEAAALSGLEAGERTAAFWRQD